MKPWQEPLVQFLVAGGLLFAAYTAFVPEPYVPREEIVIDAPIVRSLEQSFEAAWKRPPSDDERQGLIDDFLVEEVFYREAQKLGLDQDDVVIRRRMRQKMEFLLQEGLARIDPDEAALQAFFEDNLDSYRASARVSFQQVYLGEGQAAAEEAPALLAALNAATPPDAGEIGQRTMLPGMLEAVPLRDIDNTFGAGFGQSLTTLPVGEWVGPVQSGFGLHLIEVTSVQAAPEPSFEAARPAVLRDFKYLEQKKATEALVTRLKRNYDILIEEEGQP
jgi:hypothetical protein